MKVIDRILADPRVQEISDERFGSNDDGFWVYLRPGYNNGDDSAHCIHEDTPSACLKMMRLIEECNCEGCRKDREWLRSNKA